MALGMGPDARHRLRVGRRQRPRRLATPPRDGPARARDGAIPALAPARSPRRPAHLGKAARARGHGGSSRHLPRARRGRARCAISSRRRRPHPDDGRLRRRVAAARAARRPRARARRTTRSLALPPEEQYLVATGRTYFRDLPFDELHRLQFDLETTGLDPERDRIFMIAVRDPDGDDRGARGARTRRRRRSGSDPRARGARARRRPGRDREPQPARLRSAVPRHARAARSASARARPHRRAGPAAARAPRRGVAGADRRAAARAVRRAGPRADRHAGRRAAATTSPRATLPGHGLKAVARHLGIAAPGSRVHPRRVRSTRPTAPIPSACGATRRDDVEEVAAALAHARRRGVRARAAWRRAATSGSPTPGAATGVIDPLLVRAYLRAGQALPAHAGERRHAAQRRGAAPVRDRRRASRREGRRREPVSVADARVPHRPGARPARRAARARRPPRRAAARGEGGARAPRRRDRRSGTRTRRCPRR